MSEKFQELEANHAMASESVQSEKRDSLRKFDNAGSPIQNYIEEKVPKKMKLKIHLNMSGIPLIMQAI